MVTLSSCEILDELNKLGIKSSDLIQYVTEYSAYCTVRNIKLEDLNADPFPVSHLLSSYIRTVK